jgi:hypothetical protein
MVPRALPLSAAALVLASVGCIGDEPILPAPSVEGPSPVEPPSSEALEAMDAACMLRDTFDRNLASRRARAEAAGLHPGDVDGDLLAPSPACVAAIERTISWQGEVGVPTEVRLHVLAALHVLFYGNLSRSREDRILDWKASYPARLKELVPRRVDDGTEPAMDGVSANVAVRALWYERIRWVAYESGRPDAVASYRDGRVTVLDPFRGPVSMDDDGLRLGDASVKYELAATLFHELLHALAPSDGSADWRHQTCPGKSGGSVDCDEHFETSVYAMEASLLDAMVNGVIQSRRPGSFGGYASLGGTASLLAKSCGMLHRRVTATRDAFEDCVEIVDNAFARKFMDM